ncbi:tape measure protein [Nesterenkonia sp. K-15-9-6]|uniref:tape measure protein n=1 Tax=Nesterenkonia sp. K-15-9-6 TaxID=3093918 RepID=UPI0040449C5F
MANRDVTVRLSAEISGYIGPMQQAQSATDRVADSTERMEAATRRAGQSASTASRGTQTLGQSAQTASGQARDLGDSMGQAGQAIGQGIDLSSGFSGAMLSVGQGMLDARNHTADFLTTAEGLRSEFTMVGGAMAVVGGGLTALMTSVINTGIQYNTLQQVAGRAMETMAGSAEAAADQMDRLHEFADTSPFARDTWIQAQQQLMAFGMEAERVVPTLEGVENAVAAIGGGDAEIMRLVDILGQIEGQGRITGRELQRLGQMGINAADLIGDAMGVSGNEIREQITNGALDAETAITALTDGMMLRFDGAAEGLRDTMTGALDRIRARIRDLGGILAAPLVDPDGGGFLVEAINMAADFGSALLELPEPLLQIAGLGITAAGGITLVGSAIIMALPHLRAFASAAAATWTAIGSFAGNMAGIAGGFRRIGIAAGIAGAGLGSMMIMEQIYQHFRPVAQSAASMERELNALARAGDDVGTSFGDVGLQVQAVNEHGSMLPNWVGMLVPHMRSAAIAADLAEENLANMDEALASIASGGNAMQAAEQMSEMAQSMLEAGVPRDEIIDQMPLAAEAIRDFADSLGVTLTPAQEAAWLIDGIVPPAIEAAEAMDGAADAARNLSRDAFDSLSVAEVWNQIGEAAREAAGGISQLIDDMNAYSDIGSDARQTTYDWLDTLDQANEVLAEGAVSLDENTDAGRDNLRMLEDFRTGSMDAAASAAAMDGSLADVQGRLEEGIGKIQEFGESAGMSAEDIEALVREIYDIPEHYDIDLWVENRASEILEGVQAELHDLPDEWELWLSAQDQDVQDTLNALVENDHEAVVDIVGDDALAQDVIAAFQAGDYEAVARIMGDDNDAQRVVHDFTTDEYIAVADINGNSVPANEAMAAFLNGDYETVAEIYGNDAEARMVIDRLIFSDYDTTVDVNGNVFPAQSAIGELTARDWQTIIQATANTRNAEFALNWAARARTATVTLQAHTGGAASAIGRAMAGGASGRRASSADFASAMALPAFSIGGRLPSTGLGTDSILGLSRSGTPTAWVDDREWIINRQSSDKYDNLLRMINADHPAIRGLSGFASGGRPREFAASAAPPPVAAMATAGGAGGRPVNFNFHTVNPIAEPQSRTAQRSMEAIGMGWAPDEMGGAHG